MSSKSIAIAQPTFLPWLGWFDLADQVDLLVILDDVAFSKQSWQQRNRIRTSKGLEFLTVPIKTSGRLGQLIADCELTDQPFAEKMVKSLRNCYARAHGLTEVINEFEDTLQSGACTGKLVELNCRMIEWMARRLHVSTPMVRASEAAVGGERGEHVARLCDYFGATNYVSPAGSEGYLQVDREHFDERGISVFLHVYEHPEYIQCFKPFASHASAVDLIFNQLQHAPEVMRSGRRTPRPLGAEASINQQAAP
jgi:WbqC-like protein family